MTKIKKHFQENLAIYLVLITCLTIGLIIWFTQNNSEIKEEYQFDTSMFNIVDVSGANKLFETDEPKVLLIGKQGCSACYNFVPTLQIAMAKYHFNVNYLDLSDIDIDSTEYKLLLEKLDFEYTLNDKKGIFSDFMGTTPMFIIIKDNKMVYGYIGTMSQTVVKTMVSKYGVITE